MAPSSTARIHPLPPHPPSELLDAFRAIPTSLVSDCLDRLRGTIGLRPLHASGATLAGCALTVRTRPGDNLFVHKALDLARPGDVLVVDGGGHVGHALVGDILAAYARSRGIAGFVIDGAIRDVDGFRDFPCWARGVAHRGPWKDGPGEIGAPVSIDGMLVSPGDLVVADADGVVALSRDESSGVLVRARAKAAEEREQRQAIAEGRWDRTWVDAALRARGWL
jgi:regulator of RNase E activity RraA